MHTLTRRGTALVVLGLMVLVAGWILGQPAAVAVGALLLLIPLLGAVSVRRSRFVLGSGRTVAPAQFLGRQGAPTRPLRLSGPVQSPRQYARSGERGL